MALRTGSGDILKAPVEALVNPVNCVGVMGKGLALQFKRAWPAMFDDYRKAAKAGRVVPGRMHIYETGEHEGPRLIINFPTKRHWRDASRLDDIEAGLADLGEVLVNRAVSSVAIPSLGAGLGRLPWPAVRERIEATVGALPSVTVWLWEPGAPRTRGPGSR